MPGSFRQMGPKLTLDLRMQRFVVHAAELETRESGSALRSFVQPRIPPPGSTTSAFPV